MKISEILAKINEIYPDNYDREMLVDWLSEIDGQIFNEIILKYDNNEGTFTPYTSEESELIVPFPYTNIYISWLESKMSYHRNEIVRYNNALAQFNSDYEAFRNWYNNNHRHKQTKIKYFGGGKCRDRF